ncbi:hypothetical protein [Streptomyces palmae]|uniref:Guanylate cyclase domain-containing protein n=1 Tax=Streptomyces palmae TaxID=1701085 RepID=A0A4Z0H598_9ACTN|nr:hypothetical protein [Streptomyces palmae]TGB05782.1 hypothetical protein E4099_18870 [Streptomyces palmae]
MESELAYRSVLAVDIEHSAGRGNAAFWRIREVLSAALRSSFERGGIDWEACLRDDLGDGFRVVPPPGVPKAALIHPLVPELSARLAAHNRMAGPSTRVRVRMALHAGDVRLGPSGEVTGYPLEVLARLLDAAPLRTALARAPESVAVALLVSRHFHDETVRHGYPGIDPESFREVAINEKEHSADAWLHLPGHPAAPPSPTRDQATGERAGREQAAGEGDDGGKRTGDRQTGGRATMVNKASGNGVVYATQNGTTNIHITGRP